MVSWRIHRREKVTHLSCFRNVVERGIGSSFWVAGFVGQRILNPHTFHSCLLLEPWRPHLAGSLLKLGRIIQRRIRRGVRRHFEKKLCNSSKTHTHIRKSPSQTSHHISEATSPKKLYTQPREKQYKIQHHDDDVTNTKRHLKKSKENR